MSFFKKALGAIGIGAAKVNAVLADHQVTPGGEVEGILHITGGKVAQSINKLDLDIYCNYTVEEEVVTRDDDGEESTETVTRELNHLLGAFKIGESFEIAPGENREIPFSISLPESAPLTMGGTEVWLDTNLDIEMALDKSDRDHLQVVPTQLQEAFVDALENLGFTLDECDCCGVSGQPLPFVQEFEFKPRGGDYRGRLDELEVVFLPRGEELEILLEIDRKSGGLLGFFAEAMDLDESKVRLSLSPSDMGNVEDMLRTVIDQHL